ncbi:ATP-binding protein [Methanolobus sp. ZRKC2]|uniref:ATP-binding protein n=1 Tax=Methanolobus sp. ZRKC2 TaxID=3125783 RepID=UPI003253D12B
MFENESQPNLFNPRFSSRFFENYAGKMISDPKVAIIELVANAWDSGATEVRIIWPVHPDVFFEISDNGCGMTKDEFIKRWSEFNYNRINVQGSTAKIIGINANIERQVFGRNGKGRHSLFCFSKKYKVETWKDSTKSVFTVTMSSGDAPYKIELVEQTNHIGNGTRISTNFSTNLEEKKWLEVDEIKELIGTKFIVDPTHFKIYINDELIQHSDILKHAKEYEYELPSYGNITLYLIDSKVVGRTTKQHGVVWWVNGRLVGDPSWKDFKGSFLDGRSSEARRYTIIVKADILVDEVKDDWTGFNETEKVKIVQESINTFILETISDLMQDVRREEKISILESQRRTLKELSTPSRNAIGSFITQVQQRCPTIKTSHLENVVEVLASMEKSKSVYKLLKQLSNMSPDDMDSLSHILDEWDIMDAKLVLDELKKRLDLIEQLDDIVENSKTNELHELQPLFEYGLWIFGPEYESIEFSSNKSLATVLKTHFNVDDTTTLKNPRQRPDFVVLPDCSFGIYSSDKYGENGETVEVCGTSKVLIIELKRGGSTITLDNIYQANNYATEIIKSGKIEHDTSIVCYVLGTKVDPILKSMEMGSITIHPRSFSLVLRQAHSRTFKLMDKIRKNKNIEYDNDEEVEEVLKQKGFEDFESLSVPND